MYSVNIVKHSK